MPDNNNNNNRGLGTGGLFSALSGGTPAYQRSSHTAMISTGSGRSTDNPAAMSTMGSGSRAVPNSVRKGTSSRGNSNASSNSSSMSIADSALNSNKKQSSLDVGSLKIGNSIATLTTKMEAAINKQSAMIERQTTAMISRLEMINKSIVELSDLFKNANKMTLNAYDEFNRKLPKFSLLNAFTPEALYKQQLEFFNRWLTSKVTTEQLTTALLGTLKDNSIWRKLFSYDLRVAKENKQAMPWNKENSDTLNKVIPQNLKEMDKNIRETFKSVTKQMITQHDEVIKKYDEFSEKFYNYLKLTIQHYKNTEDFLERIAYSTEYLDPDIKSKRIKKPKEVKNRYNQLAIDFHNLPEEHFLEDAGKLLEKAKYAKDYDKSDSFSKAAYLKLVNMFETRLRREESEKYEKSFLNQMNSVFVPKTVATRKDAIAFKKQLMGFYSSILPSGTNPDAQFVKDIGILASSSKSVSNAMKQKIVNKYESDIKQLIKDKSIFEGNKVKINYGNAKTKNSIIQNVNTIYDFFANELGLERKMNRKERDSFRNKILEKFKDNDKHKSKHPTNKESYDDFLKALNKNTNELKGLSDITKEASTYTKAAMLAFQRFASPKSILSILMTAFKWWGMYRMLGLGTHVIRWLRDRPLIRAGGEFIKLWIWNPAKQYLIDPLIGGIRSLIVKYVSPETSKKIFDTVDSIRNAIVTVSTAMFSTDSKARGSAFSRIKTAIGGALKEYVVPPLLKIAAILYTIVRARGAVTSMISGGKKFFQSSESYNKAYNADVKNFNENLRNELSSVKSNSGVPLTKEQQEAAYLAMSKTERAAGQKFTFRERLMSLGPIKNIVEGSKQIFASFKNSFKGFKDTLSGLNTVLSGIWKGASDKLAKLGNSINGFASKIFTYAKTKASSFFTSMKTSAASFWARMKLNATSVSSSFATKHPGLASIGRGVGGVAKGVAGYAKGLFGIIGGAGKLALGVAQGASVVLPIIMMLKELFMRFVMPALSKSGVSAGDAKGVHNVIKDFISGSITKLFSGMTKLLGVGGLGLAQLTRSVIGGITGVFSGIWSGLKKLVGATNFFDFAGKILMGIIDIATGIFMGIVDAAKDAMGGAIGWILSKLGFKSFTEEGKANSWKEASISDWVMNDEKLKSKYEAFLNEQPRSDAEKSAKMISLVGPSTLAAIDKMSKDAEARERNSTYRFAIEQKQKADEQKRKEAEDKLKAEREEADANANTTEESKTDSFRDKISGAVDTLKNYFDAGKFKKDLGSLTETVGGFIKNAFNTVKSFDFRSIGNTIADKLGGFAGSLASGIMGDSSAFTMFGKLEETAKAKGYTDIERFAKKARHTIASDVQDIAEFAEKTNMTVSDIYKLLQEGKDLGWNTENAAKLLRAANGGRGIASGVAGATGSGAYINGTITTSDLGTVTGELSELQNSARITNFNNANTKAGFGGKAVYAGGMVFPVNDAHNITITGAYGEHRAGYPKEYRHAGIDLATSNKKVLPPIISPLSGTVKLVQNKTNNALGRTVVIQHDPINGKTYTTLYGHLSGFADGLVTNSHIEAGTVIGYMGGSGYRVKDGKGEYSENSFYPHLHFAVAEGTGTPYKYDDTTDPVDFLSEALSARKSLSTLNAPGATVVSGDASESGAAISDTSTIVSAATEASRGSFISRGVDAFKNNGVVTDSDINNLLNSNYFKGVFESREEKAVAARYIKSEPSLFSRMRSYVLENDSSEKDHQAELLVQDLVPHLADIKHAAYYEGGLGTLLGTGNANDSVQWITAAGASNYGAKFSDIMADNQDVQQLVAEYNQLGDRRNEAAVTQEYRKKIMAALENDKKYKDLNNKLIAATGGAQVALIQNLSNINKTDNNTSVSSNNDISYRDFDGGSESADTALDVFRMACGYIDDNGKFVTP